MSSWRFTAAVILVAACAAVFGGWLYLTLAGDGTDGEASRPISSPPATRNGSEISLAREGQVPSPPAPVAPSRPTAPPAPIPQPVAEVFGNWRVQCVLNVDGREECRAEQLMAAPDGQIHLAVIIHAPLGQRPVQLRVLPPWGVLIRAGLAVRVDSLPAFDVPILTCYPTGCQAETALAETHVQALRNGANLLIGMISSEDGRAMTTTVPLKGFAQAYARMTETTSR